MSLLFLRNEDLDVDGKIILKCMLERYEGVK